MRLVMNFGHKHRVYGKMVCAGEEFEVPDTEAVTWVDGGWARPASPEGLFTKSVDAEEEPPFKRGPGRPRKNPTQEQATYNRRDMRAEDD